MPFVEVGGARVHYRDAGTGAPALVLLHAFPLHSGMWTPQLAALSSHRRVIAPDLPGFGASDAPDGLSPYTLPRYADVVAGLLDQLGLPRVVLGGLSMGGYTALAFLRRYADRLAGLVLADTRAEPDSVEVFERRTDQQDQVARVGTTALIEVLLGGLLSDHTRAHRLDLVAHVRRLMANPAAGYIGALEAMKRRGDSTDELASISVPTLVLVGEDDVPTPPAVARRMHEQIPGSELVVLPKAGHLSNLEASDDFNVALTRFLAQF